MRIRYRLEEERRRPEVFTVQTKPEATVSTCLILNEKIQKGRNTVPPFLTH